MAGDSSRSVVQSCSKGTPVPYCSLVCFVGRFVFSNFSVSGWSGKGALASSLAHGSHESSESKTRRRTVNLHLAAECMECVQGSSGKVGWLLVRFINGPSAATWCRRYD